MKNEYLSNDQVPEFLTALRGRKEIPVKFVYLKEGALNWDTLVKDKKDGIGNAEMDLIKENIDKIEKFTDRNKFNIIDVGCGNGNKAIVFIDKFSKTYKPVNYASLDISPEMLSIAISNIAKNCNNVNTQSFCIDFEKGNFANITDTLRKVYYRNNFIIFLGNTVGNTFDMNRLLNNIRDSMTNTDLLLIGIAMETRNRNDIVSHYSDNNIYETVFLGLKKTGITKSDGHFKTVYNKKKSRVEVYFIFNKPKLSHIDKEKIKFVKGDKVLILVSYRVTKQFLLNLLDKIGFKVLYFVRSKNKENALVLCRAEQIG